MNCLSNRLQDEGQKEEVFGAQDSGLHGTEEPVVGDLDSGPEGPKETLWQPSASRSSIPTVQLSTSVRSAASQDNHDVLFAKVKKEVFECKFCTDEVFLTLDKCKEHLPTVNQTGRI